MKLKESEEVSLIKDYERTIPSIMKYMGSKKSILEFVINGIDEIYNGKGVCDLFAGTSILSGALGKIIPIHSNDIQEYSALFAKTYLSNYKKTDDVDIEEIIKEANKYVVKVSKLHPKAIFDYSKELDLNTFNLLEKRQQNLNKIDFSNLDYHLFMKYFSGTYWSYEQCVWIDALKKTADKYKQSSTYFVIISSLIYAMSYCSQSTGHVAQYRDATDEKSKDDILVYRRKEILHFFKRKFFELQSFLGENKLNHLVTTLSYDKCLDQIKEGTLVYADPPYCFVHYSRFYHAFETLVKYDYPELKFKGRYRTDRHQSPFCQRSEVKNAFETMFKKINNKHAQMVLSYSNTGMIRLDELVELANENFDSNYKINVESIEHKHSTMGRSDEKDKDVEEYLIIARTK